MALNNGFLLEFKLFFSYRVLKSEVPTLASMLSQEREDVKYDVLVYELCEGNLSRNAENGLDYSKLQLDQRLDICKQLLDGLRQLADSKKCHNDLKPENVLYRVRSLDKSKISYQIKIADFSRTGRSGGTPGWTWPKFFSERAPGKSDMYSMGLMILYVMCETTELFYCLRDNYVERREMWLETFRNQPLITFVLDMINLDIDVRNCIERWCKISSEIKEVVSQDYLIRCVKVKPHYLRVQDTV